MEHQGIMLPNGTSTMRFIQLKLIKLARECDSTIQSGTVITKDFLELEDRLEKLLYETRSAYSFPVKKTQMSDFEENLNFDGGDIGCVELVRHQKTGQPVAMKMAAQKSVTTPAQAQQLIVERDILTIDESPFITSMARSIGTDMYLGFVVNYVQGPNCESQLGVLKRFPLDMARLYVAETVMALSYLHSLDILHGDLKPSNMLISVIGHIKLTDFGMSKIGPVDMRTEPHKGSILDIVREFTAGEMTGSPVYIAPEVILQEGYGKPIDWWALGIILYEFLLGVVPFDGHSVMAQFLQVLKQKLTWPEEKHDLTDDAKALITALLKKNPAERLGTRGAHEVKDHPFFQSLNMDNLLSEVPLYIPELESGDTCSENDSESHYEEDSSVVENFEEDEEDDTPFTYVAFRFEKANEEKEDMPNNERHVTEAAESLVKEEVMISSEKNIKEAVESLHEEQVVTSSEDNFVEAAESLDHEEDISHNEENVEEVAEILYDEEDMTFDKEDIEKAAESLDDEEVMTTSEDSFEEVAKGLDKEEVMAHNEGNVEEAAEILDEEEFMTSSEENFEEVSESLDEEEDMASSEVNLEEAAESLDDEEVMTTSEDPFEEAAKGLDDEEVMAHNGHVEEAAEILDEEDTTSSAENFEEAGERLDEEEVMPNNEGNVEEATGILPHATNTMRFIYLQLLELVRECDSSIQSGMVSTKDFLELEENLEKLLYETRSAYSPPVRKPQMSDFEEIKHLATGRFASVELVRHKKTGQSFAMKLVDRESVTTSAQVQQLFVERDILTFAESPFITSMACSFETNMYLGFVMDYVEGPNCESQLDVVKRFPLDTARLYVAETVMAVKYLHSLGIVHRDLKPANLLISATGHIKLTDFGISKIGPVNMTLERHQGTMHHIVREFNEGETYGTAAYISPEMLLQEGYGKPIDWWALGIILYEFLLHDVPFIGNSKEEMFLQVLTKKLTWPEEKHDLTDDAKALITALLKKNPVERLGTRGAHEVKDHPFFQKLDMNNLLSEVPLYIPELEYTCSENDRETNDEEDPALDENPDEDKEDNTSFTYVAFCFRKAYDRPTPLKQSHSSSTLNLNEGNIQEAAESLDEEEHLTSSEVNVEDAADILVEEEVMTSGEENVEDAAEILVEEEVIAQNEGNVEEAAQYLADEEDMTSDEEDNKEDTEYLGDEEYTTSEEEDSEEGAEILLCSTKTMWLIYIQLLHLARECDSTIKSGVVSTNDFLELENKLEKLLSETRSAQSPPVRKPQMSDFEEEQNFDAGDLGCVWRV